jgi:hypothetical protein
VSTCGCIANFLRSGWRTADAAPDPLVPPARARPERSGDRGGACRTTPSAGRGQHGAGPVTTALRRER